MNKKPDYAKYSLQELYEAAETVDVELYPDRAKEIRDRIQLRIKNPTAEDKETINGLKELAHQKEKKSKDWRGSLASAATISVVILISAFSGKLVTRRHEVALEDNPILFCFIIILCVGFIAYHLIKADEQYGHDKDGNIKE